MTNTLIIVESPTKIKTLKKVLGSGFTFESSLGHVRDLPAKKFGIDLEHDFTPQYELLEGKKEVVDKLIKAAKKADLVLLSPDPDREGEAIAWHIASLLPKSIPYKRVTFNAITKEAVKHAIAHPRNIDKNLVNAQQARRLLDRMVGYKISPILNRKIHRGSKEGALSAGRVQSVALKLIVDRERAIEAFVPVEYWQLGSILSQNAKGSKQFEASLHSVDDLRVEKEKNEKKEVFLIPDAKTAKSVHDRLKRAKYKVASVEKKERKRNPVAPFITSTLQQEASRHFGFSASRTMMIAQSLYEGVDLGASGAEGLITYMRTDSTRIAPEAQRDAKTYIQLTYGDQYLPETPHNYAMKKNAQDAHEAIRPTNLEYTPETIKTLLTSEQYKIYSLVWRRYIASQMVAAIYDTVSYDIETDQNLLLRATGSVIKFQGFLIAYEEKADHHEETTEHQDKILPFLKEGEPLTLHDTFANQSFTKAPPRFTEASLVKELEKSGIGRPSTYAAIMQKIQSRQYTNKEKNTLIPTELGKIICQMLEENFPKIMDITFTAAMEDQLDKIAETDVNWKAFLKQFWEEFLPTVELAEKEAHVPKIATDLDCPKCGSKLQKIWSKDRYFYGCSRYPDCDYTAPLEELSFIKSDFADDFDWDQKCPKCGGEMKPRKSRFGIFLGCTKYPECHGIVNIPKKGESIPTDLPACPAISCDGTITPKRSRFGKIFFSCSNFPECNVIVNSLDELSTKYVNYPKTAYEGKRKAKKTAPAKAKKTSEKKPPSKTVISKTVSGKKVTSKKTTIKKGPVKPVAEKKVKSADRQQAHYRISPELSAIIGDGEVTRPEVTKRLWDYIKKHHLQDKEDRRKINPDKKLASFFGHSKPIDMMKLAGYISKHLREK